MKKFLLIGGVVLLLAVIALWPKRIGVEKSTPAAHVVSVPRPAIEAPVPVEKPAAVSVKTETTVIAAPSAVVLDANGHSVIPGQLIDASGRLLEEKVPASDGKGYVTKRYNYDADGRVQTEAHIAENGTIEQLAYTYDENGKATVKITKPDGSVVN